MSRKRPRGTPAALAVSPIREESCEAAPRSTASPPAVAAPPSDVVPPPLTTVDAPSSTAVPPPALDALAAAVLPPAQAEADAEEAADTAERDMIDIGALLRRRVPTSDLELGKLFVCLVGDTV
eukprot:729303-Prymnesium_polylepis.1